MALTPSGFIAVLAGWFVTEIGRQPYVAYGVIRTTDAVSPVVGPQVAVSLLAFIIVRRVVFAASLDAYTTHPASKIDGSRWAVSVAADAEFRYFYIVDGAVYVPECRFYEQDDFGSRNCVYVPGK